MTKYEADASGWSDAHYGDMQRYLARRAEAILTIGPRVEHGDTVLDLACGDGALADFLPAGVRYLGVDASEPMVAAARAGGRDAVRADLNDYAPPEDVAVTSCFRAIYYANDRRAFFAHVRGYTRKKLVFDLNPRQYRLDEVRSDARAAGFEQFEVRPFFVPQRYALPAPAAAVLRARLTSVWAASS
jgi:SAM-dependent methyltransferase